MSEIKIGNFVKVKGEKSIGQIVSLDGLNAEVSYFYSPLKTPTLRNLPNNILEIAEPQIQQRVYHIDPDTGNWHVGRIITVLVSSNALPQLSQDCYKVQFPNQDQRWIPPSELYFRVNEPIIEPTDFLAARINETPFWHSGRSQFLDAIIAQRNAYRGLSAMASGSIELLEHQFRVVHSVLRDPVQRYLLADEVGLGKTIEAGIVIRQYVLDEVGRPVVVIVVPPHLVEQWKNELTERFHLGSYIGKRIFILSFGDVERLDIGSVKQGMLVVDEAHHPASGAWESGTKMAKTYEGLAHIARLWNRVLLLSATPVLNNEAGFLALLHLLDPQFYDLKDLDGFRSKVRDRQTIADAHQTLANENAPDLFLKMALDDLGSVDIKDKRLSQLLTQARDVLENDVQEVRSAVFSALRVHISEVYRLHRRLLRNRRADAQDVLRARSGSTILSYRDSWREEIFTALEDWRITVTVDYSYEDIQLLGSLVWQIIELSFSNPKDLIEVATKRISGELIPHVIPQENEIVALKKLINVVQGEEIDPRIVLVIDWLKGKLDEPPPKKVIIFANSSIIADELFQKINDCLGNSVRRQNVKNVQSHNDFLESDDVRILVCDRNAEEGLNLQSTRAGILHFDLPLSPMRIEQRMGRLDRVHSRADIHSWIPIPSNFRAYESFWSDLLIDILKVFDRSIAPLQYVVEEKMSDLHQQIAENGVDVIVDLSALWQNDKEGIEQIFRQIAAQDALDAQVDLTTEEVDHFRELEDNLDIDFDEGFFQHVEAWAVRCLQFRRYGSQDGPCAYQMAPMADKNPTLLPLEGFIENISRRGGLVREGKSTVQTAPFTFNRWQATRERLALARVGHPFIDELTWITESDDRGIAWAFWRWDENCASNETKICFLFVYLIEADLRQVGEVVNRFGNISVQALRRRADEIFPPERLHIWIDEEGNVMEAPSDTVLTGYQQGFFKDKDYNLNMRRWSILEEVGVINQSDWENLCNNLRRITGEYAKEKIGLSNRIKDALKVIEYRQTNFSDIFESRKSAGTEHSSASGEFSLQLETALADFLRQGIGNPVVRPDSVGAVFLSGQNLFGKPE